jgi:BioD-like N-terminal domain of phosphotransacetylase
MKSIVMASLNQGAGKTSMIVGMAKIMKKSFGYMKPLGDRLIYKKKRPWDYDSALLTNIFDLEEDPTDMSIGFDHSKLQFMYDEKGIKAKIDEMRAHIGDDKDLLFVEGGKDLMFGTSLHLDPISVAKHIKGQLIIVMKGDEGTIMDEVEFLKRHIDMSNIDFGGVIINQMRNVDDFKDNYLNRINKMGIKILGIVPYKEELQYPTIDYIVENIFAKVLAGEKGLNRKIENVLVGAMSINTLQKTPLLKKENKLIITSGDRSDMIIAAIESDATAIILSNNILPPSNIISKASELNIPLLLVSVDTFQVAKQIDDLEPLLTKEETGKIDTIEGLVRKHVNLEGIFV